MEKQQITATNKLSELKRLHEAQKRYYNNPDRDRRLDNHLCNYRLSCLEAVIKDYELLIKKGQTILFN